MSVPIKYIDIAEFRSLGFLQEVNRRFLHPCGLALEIQIEADGTETLGGIWDYREDPEGVIFGDGMIEPEKVATVDAEIARHTESRQALFGSIIQAQS
jgi:hypothetical protein